MFSKRSRYYKLAEVVAADKNGVATRSVSFRRNPEVVGRFQHRVDASDRLDHLAYKYYKRSTQWWRVCDANEVYASPLAMLGEDSLQPGEIAIQWQVDKPDWAAVLRIAQDKAGLRNFRLGNDLQPGPEQHKTVDLSAAIGVIAFEQADQCHLSVLTQTLTASLESALDIIGLSLMAVDLQITERVPLEQWEITRFDTGEIFNIQHSEAGLLVTQVVQSFSWLISFEYDNEGTVSEVIFPALEALGITTTEGLVNKDVIGKVILIPSRSIG